jgi:hypothetical protein
MVFLLCLYFVVHRDPALETQIVIATGPEGIFSTARAEGHDRPATFDALMAFRPHW